jgi:hypothetical protein
VPRSSAHGASSADGVPDEAEASEGDLGRANESPRASDIEAPGADQDTVTEAVWTPEPNIVPEGERSER